MHWGDRAYKAVYLKNLEMGAQQLQTYTHEGHMHVTTSIGCIAANRAITYIAHHATQHQRRRTIGGKSRYTWV
jgi:hypothetical protein